jgi:hypothetical protein
MAYLALDFAAQADRAGALAAPDAAFSDTEWAAIRLARIDGIATIRPVSRIGAGLRRLFGLTAANPLADPRLEALRRAAILCRKGAPALPADQVGALLAHGFRFEQIALLPRVA